jgi:hypothetical protein
VLGNVSINIERTAGMEFTVKLKLLHRVHILASQRAEDRMVQTAATSYLGLEDMAQPRAHVASAIDHGHQGYQME